MALIDIPPTPLARLSQYAYLPHATITFNNATPSNNVFAAICMLQPGETIDSVFIVGGGAPVGTPTYNISIESATNSGSSHGGRPNGTPLTSNGGGSVPMLIEDNSGAAVTSGTVVSHQFADTYTNNTASPQMIAITIRTGTTGSGLTNTNTITIRAGYQNWVTQYVAPHYSTLVSGVWVHTGNMPSVWASDNSGRLITNTSNIALVTTETNWNSASSPNRRGIRWDAQFGCRLTSINVLYRPAGGSTHQFVVNVYNSAGVLKSTSTTSTVTWTTVSANIERLFMNVDVPPTIIERGDIVRIFIQPDATANSVLNLLCPEWTSSAQRNAFFGTSTDVFQYTSSSDGNTWTDTNTKVASIIPIIDQIDVSSGTATNRVRRTQIMLPDGRIASHRG